MSSQITGCVPGWNVHTPAERDGQMREISANADWLPKSFKCSSIGTSLLIIELKMFMDKVANRLNPTHPGLVCEKVCQAKSISSLSTSQYRLGNRTPKQRH